MPADKQTGSEITTDVFHAKVHSGAMWMLSEQVAITGSGTRKIFIKVAAGEYLHFRAMVQSAGAATIGLYETPTSSGDGNARTWLNMDRSNNNVTTIASTIFDTPTTSGNGTLLEAAVRIGTQGPNIIGASVNPNGEWILKPSTNYMLLVTDTSTATNNTTINVQVYQGGNNLY